MSEKQTMLSTFLKQVKDRFGVLEHEFGFRRVLTDDFFARWENNDVFVQVNFDARRSFEVHAEIGQLNVLFNGEERPFNFGEVARMAGDSWSPLRTLCGTSEESLDYALKELADVLKQHGQDLLRNEAIAFAILGRQRERECDE